MAKITNGDKDAGGNRVQITSENGEVSTYYMHLETIAKGMRVGATVEEGAQIGTLGGSGFGEDTKYTPHLHYELSLDGEKIDPTTSEAQLVDPQKIIDGVQLPEVSATEQKRILNMVGIIIPEKKLPERIKYNN